MQESCTNVYNKILKIDASYVYVILLTSWLYIRNTMDIQILFFMHQTGIHDMKQLVIPSSLPIERDVPLAPLTTLGTGGMASFLARPKDVDEVLKCLEWQSSNHLPLWVLGGGSNVVIADQGLPGLVLHYQDKTIHTVREDDAFVWVEVGAGMLWDDWVAHCVRHQWSGVECLSGIPGCVGASPIQNIGAYGQDLSETCVSVHVLDLRTRVAEQWDAKRCDFRYRDSVFKREKSTLHLILSVTFKLTKNGEPSLRYPELIRTVEERTKESPASLKEVRDAVLEIRRRKSMVFDLKDPNSHSAGSFFTNPIVSHEDAKRIHQIFVRHASDGETMPQYAAGEGYVKLSAAWLIQRAGLDKGTYWNTVGLSQKHTLALVNRGGARSSDILHFARFVQLRVWKVFQVQLEPEPIALGWAQNSLEEWEPVPSEEIQKG